MEKLLPAYMTSRPIIPMSNPGLRTSTSSGRENGKCDDNSNDSSVVNGQMDWMTEGVTVKAGSGVEERKTEGVIQMKKCKRMWPFLWPQLEGLK